MSLCRYDAPDCAAKKHDMSNPRLDLRALREQLENLREELQDIESTGDEAAAPVELDQTRVGRLSRMDAMQAQAMSLNAKRRRELRLVAAAKALVRLDNDDFGYCDDCGEEIAAARLSFDPTATLCIACASNREAGAGT